MVEALAVKVEAVPAHAATLAEVHLLRLESGEGPLPTKMLMWIARALGVKLIRFFEDDEDNGPRIIPCSTPVCEGTVSEVGFRGWKALVLHGGGRKRCPGDHRLASRPGGSSSPPPCARAS